MKYSLFIIIFVHSLCSNAQFGEFSFHYRFGTSTDNFKPVYKEKNSFAHKQVRTLYDHGFVFSYSYPIWKRFKIGAHLGLEFSETKRYHPLIDPSSDRLLTNIAMDNNRVSYRFGLTKYFDLFNDKVRIDFGLTFAKRNYIKNNIILTNNTHERAENSSWIEYQYLMSTRCDESYAQTSPITRTRILNAELSIDIQFKVTKNMKVHLNLAYSRNYYVLFDLEADYRYYLGGSQTPTSTFHQYGLLYSEDKMFNKNDHLLYTGLGASYNFDFKKKEENKEL